MNEIICPNCHKPFQVDEAGYAEILNQVRNHEFEEELKKMNIEVKRVEFVRYAVVGNHVAADNL